MRELAQTLFTIAAVTLVACASSQATRRVRYPDGSVRWEYQTRNGVPDGASRTFHANGTLASQGRYVKGRKEGRFTYFDERGHLVREVVYRDNVVVSHTPDDGTTPPGRYTTRTIVEPDIGDFLDGDRVPRPYFASVDRTTSLTRFGLQLGISDGEPGFAASRRAEVFANYRISPRYGAYTQLAGSMLALDSGVQIGRRTLEIGGTYHRPLYRGDLSPRLGLLVPVGGDDMDGFVPAATSSFQRPTDAAASTTETVALRTGASWTRSLVGLAMQADAGLDWLAGASGSPLDALARANAAVGYGSQNAMLSLELSNTIRLSDPAERIHALGLGGTVWLRGYWFTAFVSRTTESHTAITAAIGYGL